MVKKHFRLKIMRGLVIPLDDQDDWIQYRKKVYKLSDIAFYKHYYEINPSDFKRGKNYHLDHIYSVKEGFTNNIPIHIIASKHNIRIITAYDNISKSSRCDISLDCLFNLITYE